MAEEVTSDATLKTIDGENRTFQTVTTYENNDVKETVYQEKNDDGTFETVATLKKGGEVQFTDKADDAFKKSWEETGDTSLQSALNRGSLEALDEDTEQDFDYWAGSGAYSQWDNVGINEVLSSINIGSEGVPLELTTTKRRGTYDLLHYPEDISSTDQDRIKFEMFYISGRENVSFDLNNFDPLGNREITTIVGSATLPIPGGIQDENSVQFGGESLNMLGAAGVGAILNGEKAASAIGNFLKEAVNMKPEELQNALGTQQAGNIISALRLGLAQQFTGGNLISRIGGGILNPNMELLFQAPQLRTFNFSFTMSARSSTEATQIKKIIRFFKQGMSVKKSDDNIFVLSPNLFKIQYLLGDGEQDHPSIGRIKDCALLKLNTTYGNGNTYMTYNDEDRTMTQYKIDMTFQELNPITENDYLDLDVDGNDTGGIGY
jgi:hypothetical protein